MTVPMTATVAHRKLGPGVLLSEAVQSPGLILLSPNLEAAHAAYGRAWAERLESLEPAALAGECRAIDVEIVRFEVAVEPPQRNAAWQEAVMLSLHAVKWQRDGMTIARVPALGITVVVPENEELAAALRNEALAALRRMAATTSLRRLAEHARTVGFKIDTLNTSVELKTLKERSGPIVAQSTAILKEAATRLHAGPEPAFGFDGFVEQMAEALSGKPTQSVLLVGPNGVGKTAAIRELVRHAATLGLAEKRFYTTSGSRLVAGQCGFGMWEQRCRDLVREAAGHAVISLGSLVELMEVGKSEFNASGLAAFLRPAIARGEFAAIAECTPRELAAIEKEVPQLADAFRMIHVEEPDAVLGRIILRKVADASGYRALTEPALDAIDRLHRRYATESAFPGRPIQFLKSFPRETIDPDRVYEAFTRQTGLPRSIIDPAVPLDAAALKDWFSRRVIGQTAAVEIVCDLLAAIKTGMTRPGRPIASLLFIGPTGVGKTETAKALAEYLFGASDRLCRFDMSEYADPVRVRRLVGGADGGEGLLTAKVRERPFTVVLLDEIEKAHPSAFDLLLQVLGEARLTDAAGRLADFRNAVVVMTSNLGAASYRSGGTGFGAGTAAAPDAAGHFTKAVEAFLRPEMANRIDRIVPFAALGEAEIRSIAEREWKKALARDGLRFRSLSMQVSAELTGQIAAAGYDPQFGARPLQRALERRVLVPLADKLNAHDASLPLSVEISSDAATTVRPVPGAKPRGATAETPAAQLAEDARQGRRWLQALARGAAVRDLANEITRDAGLERYFLKRQAMGRPISGDLPQVLAKLGRNRELMERIESLHRDANAFETKAIEAFHANGDAADAALVEERKEHSRRWDALILAVYMRMPSTAKNITLVAFGEDHDCLLDYLRAYRGFAQSLGLTTSECSYLVPSGSTPLTEPMLLAARTLGKNNPISPWADDALIADSGGQATIVYKRKWKLLSQGNIVGAALQITGPTAHLHFSGEAGKHAFPKTGEGPRPSVWIEVTGMPLESYLPKREYARKGQLPDEAPRRRFDSSIASDREFDAPFTNLSGSLADQLVVVLKATARQRLLRTVLE